MIYGLSHLTFVDRAENNFINLKILKNYKKKFHFYKIKNNFEKLKFLYKKCKFHNIFFFEKKNSYNIELISYPYLHQADDLIYLKKKIIFIKAFNLKTEEDFLRLFCDYKRNYFFLKNALSKKMKFQIKVKKVNNMSKTYLNSEGFRSIVFFSSDNESLRKKILKKKFSTSKIFNFKINKLHYSIFLVKTLNNIFYEFLELK